MVWRNENDLNLIPIQTRRHFTRQLAKLLVFGGLSHFAMKNIAMAATSKDKAHEDCPGGTPVYDTCTPPTDYDYCPGETAPADECPNDGNRDEDECNSGLKSADVCEPSLNKKSDQCITGGKSDDECEDARTPNAGGDDYCPSGVHADDKCDVKGNLSAGDDCPGGGPAVDTCSPEGSGKENGDECSLGSWSIIGASEDDCKPDDKDECANASSLGDDDTCLTGKNVPYTLGANGGDDWCTGDVRASDSCWTGKEQDDLCESKGGNNGIFDECPGGEDGLDRCGSIISDDYCVSGVQKCDACPNGIPPEDSCAGGLRPDDICYIHTLNSDECDPINSGSDQNGCKTVILDECYAIDACTLSPINDIAE